MVPKSIPMAGPEAFPSLILFMCSDHSNLKPEKILEMKCFIKKKNEANSIEFSRFYNPNSSSINHH